MNVSRCEAVEVETESTVWGGMVAIRSRRLYLSACEAEELAMSLIVAANRLRTAETQPATRPLPLVEEFALGDVGASNPQPRRSAQPGGDNSLEAVA